MYKDNYNICNEREVNFIYKIKNVIPINRVIQTSFSSTHLCFKCE